jgi:hypothetical protein
MTKKAKRYSRRLLTVIKPLRTNFWNFIEIGCAP